MTGHAGSERERRHVLVTGRVQGVGFRRYVAYRAAALALAGWVRNREDGSVELEVQGPAATVRAFLSDVAAGPPGARVAGLETLAPTEESLPERFAVRHDA